MHWPLLVETGGNFLVALELLSSSHVETRVSAIKLLSLMLVGEGVVVFRVSRSLAQDLSVQFGAS